LQNELFFFSLIIAISSESAKYNNIVCLNNCINEFEVLKTILDLNTCNNENLLAKGPAQLDDFLRLTGNSTNLRRVHA